MRSRIGLLILAVAVCTALVYLGVQAARPPVPEEIASETLVAQVDLSSCKEQSFTVSPDCKRVAYAATRGNRWFVVVDGQEGKKYDYLNIVKYYQCKYTCNLYKRTIYSPFDSTWVNKISYFMFH